MAQRLRASSPSSRPVPEHLIDGGQPQDEERLIGADTGLAAVMARAQMVARSTAPVLLFGETGTGKEIIARAIHEHSTYRSGPFRRVNCGAISPELIDSELFGHEQGAFTGAVSRRRGWFEQANGGTLFLDEVGELALPAQVRLLRVVQEPTPTAVTSPSLTRRRRSRIPAGRSPRTSRARCCRGSPSGHCRLAVSTPSRCRCSAAAGTCSAASTPATDRRSRRTPATPG